MEVKVRPGYGAIECTVCFGLYLFHIMLLLANRRPNQMGFFGAVKLVPNARYCSSKMGVTIPYVPLVLNVWHSVTQSASVTKAPFLTFFKSAVKSTLSDTGGLGRVTV